jgi:nucleotide-binding universal stress UspA family protein
MPPGDPYAGVGTGVASTSLSPAAMEKLADKVTGAEQYLRRIAETFPDRPVETEVLFGDPADRILALAEMRLEPAIVMASRGRSGLSRALLGSVTARVVQASAFPVFVVRGSEASIGEGALDIETVLIPLDGSAFAEQALVLVQRLFGKTGLNLVLLRVVETQRARGAYEHPTADEYVQSVQHEASAYLEEKARQLGILGYTVTCDLGEGRVAACVNGSAHTFGVDLIALATHGSSADLRRFVLGSVAEQVLHEADRPLLLVRPPTRTA